MSTSANLRNQLQTLSISREQRPRVARKPRRGGLGLIGAVLLLLLGGGGFAAWQRWGGMLGHVVAGGSSDTPVRTLLVTAQHAPTPAPVHTATGKIVSDHQVEVATKVSGQIVALLFEQGDFVEQGQVLARIEDVNYRARRDEAAAMLAKARANLAFQKYNYRRVAEMNETVKSDIELEDARRWLADAEAQVAASEAALAFAEKALRDCEVLAPIAGVVLERNVEVGDFVAAEAGRGANANALFGVIADKKKLRVEVDVSELDIARLRVNQPCIIAPDAYKDRKYAGRVMWLDPGANYSKATVQVKVRIDEPDDFLRVEGAAQVAFYDEDLNAAKQPAESGMWIPAAAVANRNGDAGTVYVVIDGRAKPAAVTLGRKRGDHVEVLGGLSSGQTIVAEGVDKLAPDQHVKTQAASAP
jgi:HlyD family secretion protein